MLREAELSFNEAGARAPRIPVQIPAEVLADPVLQ